MNSKFKNMAAFLILLNMGSACVVPIPPEGGGEVVIVPIPPDQKVYHPMQDNRWMALSQRILQIWIRGNPKVIEEIYSPQIVCHEIDGDLVGIDAYKEFITSMRTTYTDLKIRTTNRIVDDHRIVNHWKITGTYTDVSHEDKVGREVEFSCVRIYKLASGKIVEEWAFWNRAAVLRQLGYTFRPSGTVSEKPDN